MPTTTVASTNSMPRLTGMVGITVSTSQPQPGGNPRNHQPMPPTGNSINHAIRDLALAFSRHSLRSLSVSLRWHLRRMNSPPARCYAAPVTARFPRPDRKAQRNEGVPHADAPVPRADEHTALARAVRQGSDSCIRVGISWRGGALRDTPEQAAAERAVGAHPP